MGILKNKLVVLVGGGGFLGRYTAQALMRAGARLRIAQRDPREAWFLRTQGGLGQTQFVACDLTKPDTIIRALPGADAVVNLAGTFNTSQMQAVNVDGPAALARAAAALPFVHISAIGANPRSDALYARTKGLGEAAVRSVHPQATILRPSLVFGREDRFTNRFAGLIARAPVVPVLRAGMRMQPVFVGDVALAVAAALADTATHGGQTHELGGPDTMTMGELFGWLAREIGRPERFVDLPNAAGNLLSLAGVLPGAPITRDQWKMLQSDNVATDDGLAALGVSPTPMSVVAPQWLVQYRRAGRFAQVAV